MVPDLALQQAGQQTHSAVRSAAASVVKMRDMIAPASAMAPDLAQQQAGQQTHMGQSEWQPAAAATVLGACPCLTAWLCGTCCPNDMLGKTSRAAAAEAVRTLCP
jgi:hypothetical protein